MSAARPPRRPRAVWVAAGLAAVLAVMAIVVLVRDGNGTSARLGGDGVRTFGHAPDDLPDGVVPANATEVEGTAAGSATEWTAAVTFVAPGADRAGVVDHVDGVVSAAGYVFRQRSYDEVVLEAIYDGPGATVLTVSYETLADGVGAAIVLRGSREAG